MLKIKDLRMLELSVLKPPHKHSWDITPTVPRSLNRFSPHSTVATAHSVFATTCDLNCPNIASARRSSYPIIRSPGFLPNVEYVHIVFATTFELNFLISSPSVAPVVPSSGPSALSPSSQTSRDIVFERSCELNSPDITSDH
jgi:hypothetical protein